MYPTLLGADITGLTPGIPLAFTVRSVNSVGAGPWSPSPPALLAPVGAPGVPGGGSTNPPALFPPSPTSTTSLDLTWAPSLPLGGSPVTGYLVELWGDDTPVAPVHRITLSNTAGAGDTLCTSLSECSFTLSFQGLPCTPLPLNAAAVDVRYALLSLGPNVLPSASVSVSRVSTVLGWVWEVSFTGPVGGLGAGAVPLLSVSAPTLTSTASVQNSNSNCGVGSLPPPPGTTAFDNSCLSLRVESLTPGAPIHGASELQTRALLQGETDPSFFVAPSGYFTLSVYTPAPWTTTPGGATPVPGRTTPLLPVSITGEALGVVLRSSLGLREGLRVLRTPLVNAVVQVGSGGGGGYPMPPPPP